MIYFIVESIRRSFSILSQAPILWFFRKLSSKFNLSCEILDIYFFFFFWHNILSKNLPVHRFRLYLTACLNHFLFLSYDDHIKINVTAISVMSRKITYLYEIFALLNMCAHVAIRINTKWFHLIIKCVIWLAVRWTLDMFKERTIFFIIVEPNVYG